MKKALLLAGLLMVSSGCAQLDHIGIGQAKEDITPPPEMVTCFEDNDGDNFASFLDGTEYELGTEPEDCKVTGEVNGQFEDCNDDDRDINPAAQEQCDGIDNNCSGSPDFDEDGEVDADGDGVRTCQDDCNDDPNAGGDQQYPGNLEICDGDIDNDCDAATSEHVDNDNDGVSSCQEDCDDSDNSVYPGADEQCDAKDNDCDGSLGADEVDEDADTYMVCQGDCNDDPNAGGDQQYPGNPEVCDNDIDNDCDPTTDEDIDVDTDGVSACDGDCNDLDGSVYPGAPELCDAKDNDCDSSTEATGGEGDGDGDGVIACEDCNDDSTNNGAQMFPGNLEVCDGLDNDCDGLANVNDPELELDDDSDGFYNCNAGECDDGNGFVFTGAQEFCDGLDNDCDSLLGGTDEVDGDADLYLLCSSFVNNGANPFNGGGDCNDGNPNINPGAIEICDGLDTDCNSATINGGNEADGDGDGAFACADCNDAEAASFPGNAELCDGLDNDCNGSSDFDAAGEVDGDGDGSLSCVDCDDAAGYNTPGGTEICDGQDNDCSGSPDAVGEVDSDGDFYLVCSGTLEPSAPFTGTGDCNDGDSSINPGATELCDGIDNDCQNGPDFDPAGEVDVDGDSWLSCEDCDDNDAGLNDGDVDNDAYISVACAGGTDCNDADPTINPIAAELCDGLDNDCNGSSDFDAAGEVDGDGDGSLSCVDCDDAAGYNTPGGTEICDGQDNDCSGSPDAVGEVDSDGDFYLVCTGYVNNGAGFLGGDDCDDAASTINPGASEVCDGIDNDCNPATQPSGGADVDSDGDGFAACESAECDDGNVGVYAGAIEVCGDGVINDCDDVGGGTSGGSVCGSDNDGDGYHDGISPPNGTNPGDCDDNDASKSPAANGTYCHQGVTPGMMAALNTPVAGSTLAHNAVTDLVSGTWISGSNVTLTYPSGMVSGVEGANGGFGNDWALSGDNVTPYLDDPCVAPGAYLKLVMDFQINFGSGFGGTSDWLYVNVGEDQAGDSIDDASVSSQYPYLPMGGITAASGMVAYTYVFRLDPAGAQPESVSIRSELIGAASWTLSSLQVFCLSP